MPKQLTNLLITQAACARAKFSLTSAEVDELMCKLYQFNVSSWDTRKSNYGNNFQLARYNSGKTRNLASYLLNLL